jgi:two-component system, cell cycle sensor histidine kinase and response regulator CckA
MRDAELETVEARPAGNGHRHAARDATSSSGRRWRDLAEHAPGVLLLMDRGGRIQDLSGALCGREAEEWIGRRFSDALGNAEGRQLTRALSELEHGASVRELELPIGVGPGDPRLFRFRLSRLEREADGDGAFFSAFVSDVSEQVADEQTLREREALLSRRQKAAALAFLAGGVAHDLNNLLTVIIGGADLLAEELDAESERCAELTQIQRASERAIEITRQLLSFSRREPTVPLHLSLTRSIGDLAPVVTRVLGAGIRLELSFAPDLWEVRLDPLHAEHIITHLAQNARQVMPHGGVLWLSLRNVHVDAFERRGNVMVGAGDYVQLSARDTGIGMTEAAMARVFEPFFAAPNLPGSTDLGLPLVRNLVAHALGHIWVESEPGRGTVFHVLLPRCGAEADSVPPEGDPDDARDATRSGGRR